MQRWKAGEGSAKNRKGGAASKQKSRPGGRLKVALSSQSNVAGVLGSSGCQGNWIMGSG